MENKSIIAGIREFFLTCPFLKEGILNVDYLGITPREYSVDGTPSKSIIKQYVDGSAIRQFTFSFCSLENYGTDVDTNLANNCFYEKFSAWLLGKSCRRELPQLGEGKIPINILAEGDGYIADAREDVARYQIQCRLIYFQRGEENIW